MPWLTNLASIARRTGYPVVEVSGWKTRGHGEQPAVRGIVCHHTAGWGDRHVVVNGRPGLDGPLSHFWLSKTGEIHVVAAGRCWHNAPSTSPNHTNSNSIGIEAENDGRTPWPTKQLDAYVKLCAELCRAFGLPASAVKGHKEVNTSKPDPHSINMNDFRAKVAAAMKGEDVSLTAKDVYKAVWETDAMKVSYAKPDNPTWKPASVLINHGEWLRKINGKIEDLAAKVEAQSMAIRQLAEGIAAATKGEPIDVDKLVARIESAIENITVRLTVTEE